MNRMPVRVAILAASFCLCAPDLFAEQPGAKKPGSTAVTGVISAAPSVIEDALLLTAQGQRIRLKNLLKSRRVTVISLTYTGCQAICPTSDLLMNALVDEAQAAGETDIGFVTLTLDPFSDTPEALKRRAAEIGAGESRVWLTGDPSPVFTVLDGLGVRFGRIEDHTASYFISNSDGSKTLRVDGLPDPKWILAAVRGVR
jgi:protein SCO1